MFKVVVAAKAFTVVAVALISANVVEGVVMDVVKSGEVAANEVNVPAAGVVAPTVPFIFIEAVPVRFVTVPDDGVPSAPLNVTNAPAEPTLTPSAVNTPVPVVVVAGVAPAPPPIIIALAASKPEDAQVEADEK